MAKLETLETSAFAQTEIIVIPMIDVSGSMAGQAIGMVNDAMAEVPEQLVKINDDSLDAKIKIAPMEFSTGARWFALQNGEPADPDTFRWIDMKAAGLTDLGAAFNLLYEKLTVEEKGGWMKGRGGAAPIILLISDGEPTDNYKAALDKLKQRGWFKAASKFAVAVGDGANTDILKEFCGFDEAVISTDVISGQLSSIIKTVVVTASQTKSQTTGIEDVKPKNKVEDNGDLSKDEDNIEEQKQVIQNVVEDLNINEDYF